MVAGDERESGPPAILNYGHTLGHALEIATGFELRHGEAVAIGMVFAAELACVLGRIDAAAVAAQRRLVASYDLATTLPDGLDEDELVALMARDKKAVSGLTFVLDGARGVETVTGVDRAALAAAFAACGPRDRLAAHDDRARSVRRGRTRRRRARRGRRAG